MKLNINENGLDVKLVQQVLRALPDYIFNFITKNPTENTPADIMEAAKYHADIIEKHPNKEILYFLGDEDKDDMYFIIKKLAQILYFKYCDKLKAYGCLEIYNVLLQKKIPAPIVKFYIETQNGGCTELNIIKRKYGYGDGEKPYSAEMEMRDQIAIYPEDKEYIEEIWNKHLKAFEICLN